MPFTAINLDEMHKEVLAWDLYQMVEGRAMYSLRDVPVRFSSVDEYLDVFEPLLLEECRSQTLRSLRDTGDGNQHHLKLVKAEANEPFRLLSFELPQADANSSDTTFCERDLVFVSYDPLDIEGIDEGAAPQEFHALALVERIDASMLIVKVYLPQEPTSRLPPAQHKRLKQLRKVFVAKGFSWHVRKLGNMITINREFQALYAVRELALMSMLLAPGGSTTEAPPPSLQPPDALMKAIEKTHNPSQLAAIRTCLCGRGVTLIQGPPGTGKTKTILGILSALLASHSRPGRESRPTHGILPPSPFLPRAERTPEQTAALLRRAAPWLPIPPPPVPEILSATDAAKAKAALAAAKAKAAKEKHALALAKAAAAKAAAKAATSGSGSAGSLTTDKSSDKSIATAKASPVGCAPSKVTAAAAAAAAEEQGCSGVPRDPLPHHPFPRAAVVDQHIQLGRAAAEMPPKHMLVCSPSNAAIDEIVARLLDATAGMLNERGEHFRPSILRVGPNVKESLLEVALDTQAKKKQASEHEKTGESLTYDQAKKEVLNEASIVCTTLSCAGYAIFSGLKQGFDTVLIDEAAQAVEMSVCERLSTFTDPRLTRLVCCSPSLTLIPLKYNCRRLILVGDPNQLPAYVCADIAKAHNYEMSLFQRLQQAGQSVAMLKTQYRMHPQISHFPASQFYDKALNDAPGMAQLRQAPWHAQRVLGPYIFYDVEEGIASEAGTGWSNELEALLALEIVQYMLSSYPDAVECSSIGIISPYNGQVKCIRKLLVEKLGEEIGPKVEVNSVDGFQGREKAIIILSCVRSDRHRDEPRGIGFLKDKRRMNVSVTRARQSVFILGHAETLRPDPLWNAALCDAEQRGCLITARVPVRTWFEAAVKQPATTDHSQAADASEASGVEPASATVAVAAVAPAKVFVAPRGKAGKKARVPQ